MRLVCFVVPAVIAAAQTQPVRPAVIEGKVVGDSDEKPLRRAHVTLRPMEAGLNAIGADADDTGSFVIRDIPAGRYVLTAQRDGYLSSSTVLRSGMRMPQMIAIRSGDRISSLTFRLRPSAVIAGHIRFEDAEPAVNVRVDAYREYFAKGQHRYNLAGSARTDDRGEYRIHGLGRGSYIVAAAVYERVAPQQGYIEQARTDDEGREIPAFVYTTTFFPNTTKLTEAIALSLDYGKELGGIDVYLNQVRKVKIRGRVLDGESGRTLTSATITVQSVDSHQGASIPAPVQTVFAGNGDFEIRGVTPGTYLITAEGGEGKHMIGRAMTTVAEENIEHLELMVAPARECRGTIRVQGVGELDPNSAPIAIFEPRTEMATALRSPVRGNEFTCALLADETYDFYMQNLPDDFFVLAIRANGMNFLSTGISGSYASPDQPFEVVLDSHGGRVGGVVVGADGNAWSGANLALIPDPPGGRLQSYRNGSADEYGRFQIRGVAPGAYLLVAWLDDPPCDFYNPSALDACRSSGMQVTVDRAAQKNVVFTMSDAVRK